MHPLYSFSNTPHKEAYTPCTPQPPQKRPWTDIRLPRWIFHSKLIFRWPLLGLCCYTLPKWMPFFLLSIYNICLIRILILGRKQRICVTPTRHLPSLGPPVPTALALMLVPLASPDFSGLTIILFTQYLFFCTMIFAYSAAHLTLFPGGHGCLVTWLPRRIHTVVNL